MGESKNVSSNKNRREFDRPNILWIMFDQHKDSAFSAMWKDRECAPWYKRRMQLTPHLDRLSDDGVLFENAYSPSPVCAPARACMKTGKYPAANGTIGNWMPFQKNQRFLPGMLRENGYDTGMVGKLHFFPPEADYGFIEYHLSDAPYSVYADDDKHSEYIKWLRRNFFDVRGIDPVEIFDADELCYDTDIKRFCMGSCFRARQEHEAVWTTDLTINYLKNRKSDKPFFFYTSYFGPHQPYGAPEPYADMFSPDEIILPESFYEDLNQGDPVFEKTARSLRQHIKENMNERDCRELVAAYLGQVVMLDDEIGRLINYLKESGLYDSTTIIFTSDHGENLCDHGMFFKAKMYDSCLKVPLIIKPAGKPNVQKRAEVVNTIDLFRTVLDMTGTGMEKMTEEELGEIESRSLVPMLSGGETSWDNVTYSILGTKKENLSCMIRDGAFKLLRAGGKENAVYELYCVAEDPKELHNLYEELKYRKIREGLQEKLETWFAVQYARYTE